MRTKNTLKRNEWQEQDLLEVLGMATNPANPGLKYAQRILNAHVHTKPGALVLRPGYELKYSAPSDSTITDDEFLNFENFYDRAAKSDGQEIICLIQKGTLNALDNSGTPIVADTLNGFWFWAVPHWELNHWQDSYGWVNKTIITKITVGSDATYKSMIKVFGNSNHLLGDGSLDKWIIYNKTKEEYAQIITTYADGNNLRLNHTLYNSSWDVDDVVIISKYWIDLDAQAELYANVGRDDISFHHVLDDLRIGFGGKQNRPGIAIGYRQTFGQLVNIDFPHLHADLQVSGALEDFAEINDLILDTSILDKDAYGIELTASGDGSLTENIYYFRLTGTMDNYAEQLLAEDYISVDDDSAISIKPYLRLGKANPRITDFTLYYSTDNITFYKIQDFTIRDTAYNAVTWKIDQFSRMVLLSDQIELHDEANAATPDDPPVGPFTEEINSVGSWTVLNDGALSVSTDAALSTAYSLKFEDFTPAEYQSSDRNGIKFPVSGIKKGSSYTISAYLKANIPYKKIYFFFVGASESPIGRTQVMKEVLESDYAKYEVDVLADDVVEDITHLAIAVAAEPGDNLYLFGDGTKFSEDDGATFDVQSTGINTDNKVIILGDRLLTYITTGIYVSYDKGVTWTQLGSSFPSPITNLTLLGENIYVGLNNGGIHVSDDRGVTFTQLSADISGGSTYSIRGIAQDTTYLYAATVGGGVYRSDDDGATWNAAITGLTDSDIYDLYADETNLIAVANDGTLAVWKSTDNADNWSDVTGTVTGSGSGGIIFDGTYYYVATHDYTHAVTCGVWQASSLGTWTDIAAGASLTEDEGYKHIYIRNDVIYFGSYDSSDGGKLYYTDDAGSTITELTAGAISTFAWPQLIGDDNTFLADYISIKQKDLSLFSNVSSASTEMKSYIGYTPIYSIVKGWDQAISLRGRIYYLNPYLDKRYENFILVSHIHSTGAYMWDIASFSNYRELERHDSNKSLGMEILPTTEIIVIKDKSAEIFADDGLIGAFREPITGVSCTTKNGIVNLAGLIVWTGKEDLWTYSVTRGAQPRLVQTIRDSYLAIDDKTALTAVRDRFNTYRLRVDDETNKTEFLFYGSDFDVIEENKYLFAEVYRDNFGQKLDFLNDGDIYGTHLPLDSIGYGKLYSSRYGEVL